MTRTFEERVLERREQEARAAFASYAQSVAFQVTLSRNMIDLLGLVRDAASVSDALHDRRVAASGPDGTGARDYVASYLVPLMNSLIRRGLVLHCPFSGRTDQVPAGWKWYALTRAGQLMCDLLVEAGALPARASSKRRA